MLRIMCFAVAAWLVVLPPARADLTKYYPDGPLAIFVLDLDKMRQSPPGREILGQKSSLQFLKELIADADPKFKKDSEGAAFGNVFKTLNQVEINTRRCTFVLTPQGFSFDSLILLEGKYNLKQDEAAKFLGDPKERFCETFGKPDLIVLGSLNLRDTVLARHQGTSQPKLLRTAPPMSTVGLTLRVRIHHAERDVYDGACRGRQLREYAPACVR